MPFLVKEKSSERLFQLVLWASVSIPHVRVRAANWLLLLIWSSVFGLPGIPSIFSNGPDFAFPNTDAPCLPLLSGV